ncbi:hypothetical protein VNO77_43438 [Canavalia gladiata]|uniref:Uncharacterized protein n=1 Tax=Canavalia gladiata TaxID=3824 RepID=A0AAN9JUU3_CANGL
MINCVGILCCGLVVYGRLGGLFIVEENQLFGTAWLLGVGSQVPDIETEKKGRTREEDKRRAWHTSNGSGFGSDISDSRFYIRNQVLLKRCSNSAVSEENLSITLDESLLQLLYSSLHSGFEGSDKGSRILAYA